jgi:hypothetical protein
MAALQTVEHYTTVIGRQVAQWQAISLTNKLPNNRRATTSTFQ